MTNFAKEKELWYNGKCYIYRRGGEMKLRAHVVWNKYHPDDPIDGELIHHKDGDRSNDSPDNLEKMTFEMHGKIHADIARANMREWREENPEEWKRLGKRNGKRLRNRINNDPELKRRMDANRAKSLRSPESRKKMSESAKRLWRRKKEAKLCQV